MCMRQPTDLEAKLGSRIPAKLKDFGALSPASYATMLQARELLEAYSVNCPLVDKLASASLLAVL